MRALVGLMALALAGCSAAPRPVAPALWEVTGPQGQKGWLFGTIHALPRPVAWRTARLDAALTHAGVIVTEILPPEAGGPELDIMRSLSQSSGLPPLDQRVSPALRPQLARIMRTYHLKAADYASVETWAAAFAIANAAQDADPGYGMETELAKATAGKPQAALEGFEAQLRIFDTLPLSEQRDLLDGVVEEAAKPDAADTLGKAWATGDMAAMERETRTGLLADRELREALLVRRNHAWAEQLPARMRQHPFVAVGAAHLAGPDGLPALLAARGYTVTRIQ